MAAPARSSVAVTFRLSGCRTPLTVRLVQRGERREDEPVRLERQRVSRYCFSGSACLRTAVGVLEALPGAAGLRGSSAVASWAVRVGLTRLVAARILG